MPRKNNTLDEFNNDIARKTGSDIRIVTAALPTIEESERFHKIVQRKSRHKTAGNLVALACFAGTIYSALTTEIGYTETRTPYQVNMPQQQGEQSAQHAVYSNAAWENNIQRHFKSNIPQKFGYLLFFFGVGGMALISANNANKHIQESRKDLRTMALIPQPKV